MRVALLTSPCRVGMFLCANRFLPDKIPSETTDKYSVHTRYMQSKFKIPTIWQKNCIFDLKIGIFRSGLADIVIEVIKILQPPRVLFNNFLFYA